MTLQTEQSMTAIEYLQRIPVSHIITQQKVNTEVWHWWNLVDHERAVDGGGWTYYSPEEHIISPGVELAQGPSISSLSLSYTICSRRWIQEQECRKDARIGDIFLAKDGTGRWDTSGVLVTYALERVDDPRRWNKYCVRHMASESFQDVIREHTRLR